VRLPDRDGDGVADGVEVVASGLRAPSSIAFYTDGSLYVGETTRILRLSLPDEAGVFQVQETIIDGLPSGGHSTRTVLFSPDGAYLFVSVGSSCNVCTESDERRATIMRYNPDGTGGEVYARGLRNAVGITFRPGTDELWATNNGRDQMGDDLPPETVYQVHQGDDAGWPRCHAGRIEDPSFGRPGRAMGSRFLPSRCRRTRPPWGSPSTRASSSRKSTEATCSWPFTDRGTAVCRPGTRWCAFPSAMGKRHCV